MNITKIEKQKNNEEKYNIYIDGEYLFSLPIDLLHQLKLKEDMLVNPEELQEIVYRAQYSKAFSYSLHLLAVSNKTEYQIRKKLSEKSYDENIIEEIIVKLKELKYINDEIFTESWIKSNMEAASINNTIIYNKLRQKGIPKALIDEKLADAPIDEIASALKIAEKKVNSLKGDNRQKRMKLFSFLYNKGFKSDTCRKVVNKIFNDIDEDFEVD